ncbi:MAG: type II toxin-antitoxin system VapC family toxin [Sphingopyxis sp.]
MKLLLDTNALIWWLRDDPRLGPRVKQLIADEESKILVSIVSLWEISMKWRVGKLEYAGSTFLEALEAEEIEPLAIATDHLLALETLGMHHKDPFDHLIIAQAKVERAIIITSDREMAAYGVPCIGVD